MAIPAQYHGRWSGITYDVNRVNPYRGEIVLTADGGNSTYHMSRGDKTGTLSQVREVNGSVEVYETMLNGGVSGTLSFVLDGAGGLECTWQNGCKATMTRS